MKVAGFSFIRNALLYDYPVVEAIRSILPLCDYLVVAVGQSEDDTLALVRSINDPRLHIVETQWDDSLRAGGRVLAVETDKAFQAIPNDYDWCVYIQADECVHEDDFPAIRTAMQQYLHDSDTDGLLLHYRHFYGSYDFVGASRRWYRREVRIVRNNKRIGSYRDAQGFRLGTTPTTLPIESGSTAPPLLGGLGGAKLRVRLIPAHIYHYGWVKHPAAQQRKQQNFNRLWHDDDAAKQRVGHQDIYDYNGTEPLQRYTSTHPAVMQPRIAAMNWRFAGDPTQARWSWKDRVSNWVERSTGWRPGEYRNYVLLK